LFTSGVGSLELMCRCFQEASMLGIVRTLALLLSIVALLVIPTSPVNAANCPSTVPFGEVFTCSVSTVGEIDEYAFTAAVNDRFFFRISRTSGDLDPYFLILDPQNNTLCSNYTYNDTATADCTANRSGNYKLRIRDADGQTGNGTGNYSFYAQRVNAVGNASTIIYGTPVNGNISDIIQSNTYTFVAQQNDQLRLQIVRDSGNIDPYFSVYNAQGSELDTCSNYTYSDYVYRNCTINADGTYTILTGDTGIDGTGSYSLRVQRYNAPGGTVPLELGRPIAATIAAPAESDVFDINLAVNDKLIIRLLASSGNLDPQWYLTNSAGTAVCDTYSYGTIAIDDACTINASGRYSLFVEDTGDTNTGDYRLLVQRLNAPLQALLLSSGQTLNGNLAANADFNTYTLAALTGSKVNLTLDCTAGQMQAWMRLYNPAGLLVAERYTYQVCGDLELTYTSTLNGAYTLIVADSDNEGVGDYTVRLAPLLSYRVFVPLMRR
jgi:hypothetical protein